MNTLDEMALEAKKYIETFVVVTFENLRADVPNAISPGEGFTFDLKWKNTGSLVLNNVRIQLVAFSTLRLEVPATGASEDLADDNPLFRLAPGSLHTEMVLYPSDLDRKILGAGETDSWLSLRGRAGTLGTSTIRARVIAGLSVQAFFPTERTSAFGGLKVDVV